jgi:hypothetical protein
MGLAGLAGASYYLGKANVIRDPQERNRIKELELRDKRLSDIGMGQIQDIIKLKKENVRLEGRERYLSDLLNRGLGFGEPDLIQTSSAVASKTQTLNPISHDEIVERQQQRRARDEGQVLRPLNELMEQHNELINLVGERQDEIEKLYEDRLEATREIRGISDEMSRMVSYMNEPQGIDI